LGPWTQARAKEVRSEKQITYTPDFEAPGYAAKRINKTACDPQISPAARTTV
jgi:hypothetical protein